MDVTETDIQTMIRLRASQLGMTTWRNNRGAFQDKTGRWIRYGLANDSTAVARELASADLIGVRPMLVGLEHVGTLIGVFTSIEVKRPGERLEVPQEKWLQLVQRLGGDARVVTSADDL